MGRTSLRSVCTATTSGQYSTKLPSHSVSERLLSADYRITTSFPVSVRFFCPAVTAHFIFFYYVYGLLHAWLNVFSSEVLFVVVRLAEAEALENMKT